MTFEITKFNLSDLVLNTIEYFGTSLQVLSTNQYIATDEDGSVYVYQDEPWISDGCWQSATPCMEYLGDCVFNGDWKESLMEIENV
jgi:hypothetical protein